MIITFKTAKKQNSADSTLRRRQRTTTTFMWSLGLWGYSCFEDSCSLQTVPRRQAAKPLYILTGVQGKIPENCLLSQSSVLFKKKIMGTHFGFSVLRNLCRSNVVYLDFSYRDRSSVNNPIIGLNRQCGFLRSKQVSNHHDLPTCTSPDGCLLFLCINYTTKIILSNSCVSVTMTQYTLQSSSQKPASFGSFLRSSEYQPPALDQKLLNQNQCYRRSSRKCPEM